MALEVEPINFHFSNVDNTEEHNMVYRCEAQSPEAVVQLIAASYLRHGFYK